MEEKVTNVIEQFVVFALGEEEYGIDIKNVVSIEHPIAVARVPKTPNFVKGVINLRGEIIPVFDLRKRFDLPDVEETDETRIIILNIGDYNAGVVVDIVVEVVQMEQDSIENANIVATDVSMDYIGGIGKIEGKIVTLLNLEKLIRLKDEDS